MIVLKIDDPTPTKIGLIPILCFIFWITTL